MKSEKEIREHLNSSLKLTRGTKKDCDCPDCVGNKTCIAVLKWVLGENEAIQPAIDAWNEQAAKEI